MDLERVFQEIDLEIKRLELENKTLTEENNKLNKELDDLAGYEIDKYSLKNVTKSSDLIKEIEKRYNNAGMKVICCRINSYDKNTFKLEVGNWRWKGKVKFIGKQYFRTKRFSSSDCDGYDDTNLFVSELLGIVDCGFGGIAGKWYRHAVSIPDGFVFDKEIGF